MTSPWVAHGDVDLAAEDTLCSAIDGAIREVPETVVVDLSGTEFLDSTAVHLLVAAERHARPLRAPADHPGARCRASCVLARRRGGQPAVRGTVARTPPVW
jgi:hypothetical protein